MYSQSCKLYCPMSSPCSLIVIQYFTIECGYNRNCKHGLMSSPCTLVVIQYLVIIMFMQITCCASLHMHGHTWNHCPLGRAGGIHEAKKIPLTPNKGQAVNMRTPCARTRGNLGKLSSSPFALSFVGLYFLADILGESSWVRRPLGRDGAFRRPKRMKTSESKLISTGGGS